jgi:hypothetical protein
MTHHLFNYRSSGRIFPGGIAAGLSGRRHLSCRGPTIPSRKPGWDRPSTVFRNRATPSQPTRFGLSNDSSSDLEITDHLQLVPTRLGLEQTQNIDETKTISKLSQRVEEETYQQQ